MKISDLINETTAGAVASVATPMGKMIKRPSPSVFPKKKKKVAEGPSRDSAVDILVALVKERGLDNFDNKDEIESYMSDNMPAFYRDRDTGKAIEDAMAKLDLDESIVEDYDPALVSMLAKFEDDCQDYGYYGDTDMVTVDQLLRAGDKEEAVQEMASAMTDEKGGSDKFDDIYSMALDAVEDYMHVEEMRKLAGMPEGKSPHKKGTKKYKAHMAAMHAGG